MVTVADQIADLKRRLYSGVSLTRNGDQTVQYMSRADMEALLTKLQAEQAGTSVSRVHYSYQVSRGL